AAWPSAPPRGRPCQTGASPRLKTCGRPSPQWGLAPLLLEARADLVRPEVEMGREDEHHVEEVRQLAERALAPFPLQRRSCLLRLLDQLRRNGRSATAEELR